MTTIVFVANMVECIVVVWANLMLGILACYQLRKLKDI